MPQRSTRNSGRTLTPGLLNRPPMSENEKPTTSIPKTGKPSTPATRVKSIVRNILLASPAFPRLYADVVISSAPNSNEAKILARNYQKIIDRTNMPNIKSCTHIKVTGVRCGSPALRGEQFCYFHQRMMRGVQTPPNARLHAVALIEDEEAIQASLMEVINALARNTIDLHRAQLILRALSIAVRNARRVRFALHEDDMVREVPAYPAPPKPASQPAATEAPTEVNAPPLTPLQTWANLAIESAPTGAPPRKPPARAAEAPKERKNAAHGASHG